eukprot:gene13303-42534_t
MPIGVTIIVLFGMGWCMQLFWLRGMLVALGVMGKTKKPEEEKIPPIPSDGADGGGYGSETRGPRMMTSKAAVGRNFTLTVFCRRGVAGESLFFTQTPGYCDEPLGPALRLLTPRPRDFVWLQHGAGADAAFRLTSPQRQVAQREPSPTRSPTASAADSGTESDGKTSTDESEQYLGQPPRTAQQQQPEQVKRPEGRARADFTLKVLLAAVFCCEVWAMPTAALFGLAVGIYRDMDWGAFATDLTHPTAPLYMTVFYL